MILTSFVDVSNSNGFGGITFDFFHHYYYKTKKRLYCININSESFGLFTRHRSISNRINNELYSLICEKKWYIYFFLVFRELTKIDDLALIIIGFDVSAMNREKKKTPIIVPQFRFYFILIYAIRQCYYYCRRNLINSYSNLLLSELSAHRRFGDATLLASPSSDRIPSSSSSINTPR